MLPKAVEAGLQTYKTFLFTYEFQDERWEIAIKAKTQVEALHRLQALRDAEYTGELMATVSVGPSWWWTMISRWV